MKLELQKAAALWICAALVFLALGIPGGAVAADRKQWSGTVNITADTTIAEGVDLIGDTVLNISEGAVLTVQNAIFDQTKSYSLTVNGPGKLIVTSGEKDSGFNVAISAGKISLQNGVTVEATGAVDGIRAEVEISSFDGISLTISGAKVTAKGTNGGIVAHGGLEITNGADVEAFSTSAGYVGGPGLDLCTKFIISESTLLCQGSGCTSGIKIEYSSNNSAGQSENADVPIDINIENSMITAIGGEVGGHGIYHDMSSKDHPIHMTIDKNSLVKAISGSAAENQQPAAFFAFNAEITIQGDSYLSLTGDSSAVAVMNVPGNTYASKQTINLNSGSLFLGASKSDLISLYGDSTFTLNTKVAGRGWSDPDKSGTETALAANTYDANALKAYKSAFFTNHTHHFTYTADGGTLTANCLQSCTIPMEERIVTVTAPTNLANDGTAKVATMTSGYSEVAFPEGVSIAYYSGDTKLAGAPVDAGTYTARISQKGVSAMVEFTIPKLDSAVTKAPAARDLTWTGEAQELVTAGEAKGGVMVYSLDGNTWSQSIPTATEAGEYTVYYKAAGDKNHNDTTPGKVTVTIAALITPEPTEVPKTGDGASPLGWLLMALAGLAVVSLIVSRRRAR